LVRDHGEDLLGIHHPQPRFPLLLKYLDAQARLSVQVHPDDEFARRMASRDPGKSEAWVIVDAKPGSVLWAGLTELVDRATLCEAIQQGHIERYLHRCQAAPGDCFFLPAGTVHALGEGLLVAEIQSPSDTTFRLDDWGRVDADGNPRPLHVAQALAAMRLPQGPVTPQQPRVIGSQGRQRLVECEKFVLDRWVLASPGALGGDDRCHALTVLQGKAHVEGDASAEPLCRGQSMVLPAVARTVRIAPLSSEPVVLLDAFLP
jgi:mannose-6-phosphate isomerase